MDSSEGGRTLQKIGGIAAKQTIQPITTHQAPNTKNVQLPETFSTKAIRGSPGVAAPAESGSQAQVYVEILGVKACVMMCGKPYS